MAVQLPNGRNYFEATGGGPGVGYKLYTYVPGTSTPKATYTTSAASVANQNPVVMDSRGEAAIYWSGSYDVVLKDASDALVWGPERLESDFGILADLADPSSAANGAGAVGYASTTPYLINSVGYTLNLFGVSIAANTSLLSNLFTSKIPTRSLGVPVFGSIAYDAFGDSYTTGTGATAATCYAAIIGARFNTTFGNRGVSGRGVTTCLTQAWANLPKYHMRSRLITWMAGFNDLHFAGGAPTVTLTKIKEGARAFMANAFLKQAWAANDTSVVTQTGVWNNSTPNLWGEKAVSLGGRSMYNNTSGSKLSFAFTGENVVFGTWSNKNSTYTLSPVDVYIDGVFVETYTPNNTTDGNVGLADTFEGLTHTARVYTNLGSGAHTIEIRNTANNYVMADYFGTLAAPSECPSLLMGGVCYVDATGYAGPEAGRSQTTDDAASAVILTEVNTFAALGYPVAFVPPNDYYNATTQIHTDHDHPGPAGHKAIANAFISRAYIAANAAQPSCSLTKSATQAVTTATLTAVTFSAAVDDRLGFFAVANPSRIVAPMSGTMRLSGVISWAPNATGIRALDIYLNGGGSPTLSAHAFGGFINNDNIYPFSVDIPVNAGDYAELKVSQNSGGNLNLQTTTRLDVLMVR